MLAELLDGFDEAVGNASQERPVSKRADYDALTTRFSDEIGVNEKL